MRWMTGMLRVLGVGMVCGLAAGAPLAAQTVATGDARTVVEPTFPATCTVLTAQQGIASGEPQSETTLDTARIQAALTGCASGSAVELALGGTSNTSTNNAFVTGPITIPAGVTLLVDGGVTLFGSRNPADYQSSTAGVETCGTVGTAGNGCLALITASGANSGIMGYGVIDGRGQDKLLVNGAPATYSWWDQAGTAQNTSGGSQNNPILVSANAANLVLYKITVRNSPMFHIKWTGNTTNKTGFTAWGVKVITPFSARNSDGIDPAGQNITVTNSSISDGDDNVAVSASSTVANVTVQNTTTYSGHGISVGSITKGGLTNMLVQNITQVGTAADKNGIGLRIKAQQSNGGLVQNVTYQNICSANNRVSIYLGPYYSTAAGTSYPKFTNIIYRNIHVATEGLVTMEGYQNTGGTVVNPSSVTFDNLILDGLQQKDFSPAEQNLQVALGPNPVTQLLQTQTGTNITYTGGVTNPNTAPYPCDVTKFQYLVGELFGSTATATNLQTASLTGPGTITLNAMLQPAMSQVTYASTSSGGTYTGMPAPTAQVQFLEGSNVVGTGTLGGNGTIASATLTGVTPGTHTYTAYYPGDATYTVPYTFGTMTITVAGPSASTTTLVANPTTVTYGASTTLTATVASGVGAAMGIPTGKVAFMDGASTLATVTLSGGTASTTQVLGGGSHSLTAVYAGDANFVTSTSAPATTLSVGLAAPVATIQATPSTLIVGGTVVLSANVARVGAGSTPTGTVQFVDGASAVAGSGTVDGSGNVSATVTPGVGPHSYTAVYAGDANYLTATSGAAPVTVSMATTTTTLVVSSASIYAGGAETFTATVKSNGVGAAAIPVGTVTFANAAGTIGTTAVNAAGVATLTVTESALGMQTVTATFAPSSVYGSSVSGGQSFAVVAPYAVAVNPASLSLAVGGTGTVAISLQPGGGYTGVVSLSCSSPVTYVSCTVSPASATVSGGAAITTTATISVATKLTALELGPLGERGSKGWLAVLLPLGGLGWMGRRKRWAKGLMLVVMLMAGLSLSGCGAGSAGVPAGTQTITVSAIGGNATAQASVALTITK